mgnify:CR=1 FL=1
MIPNMLILIYSVSSVLDKNDDVLLIVSFIL